MRFITLAISLLMLVVELSSCALSPGWYPKNTIVAPSTAGAVFNQSSITSGTITSVKAQLYVPSISVPNYLPKNTKCGTLFVIALGPKPFGYAGVASWIHENGTKAFASYFSWGANYTRWGRLKIKEEDLVNLELSVVHEELLGWNSTNTNFCCETCKRYCSGDRHLNSTRAKVVASVSDRRNGMHWNQTLPLKPINSTGLTEAYWQAIAFDSLPMANFSSFYFDKCGAVLLKGSTVNLANAYPIEMTSNDTNPPNELVTNVTMWNEMLMVEMLPKPLNS